MSDTILISPETFALGDFVFRFTSRHQEVLDGARKLYRSTCSNSNYRLFDLDSIEARIVASDPATIFHSLITDAYRYHDGHLYIDGCAFMTNRSELVLLAGASHAGKTTLTVAAAGKLGWKIISEDLVLIDSSLTHIVPFVHPLSLRVGAQDLIMEATGIPPSGLYLDRWLVCPDMFYTGAPVPPKFSLTILIQSDAESSAPSLTLSSAHEFLRALLPLSNALHMDNGLRLLHSCIDMGPCYIMRGGSVGERLALLAKLTS